MELVRAVERIFGARDRALSILETDNARLVDTSRVSSLSLAEIKLVSRQKRY